MRVLVIGGTGDLGHRVANGLAAQGHAVMAVVSPVIPRW